MKSKKTVKGLYVTGLLYFLFAFAFMGQMLFSAPESSASGAVCSRVLEIGGVVESKMPGEETGLLRPGTSVTTGEELDLKPESWIVLIMADSTIRKFSGPATITMKETLDENRGSILTRLGSALVSLLFAQEQQEGSEVVMVTRRPTDEDRLESSEIKMSRVPLVVRPAPGSSVFQPQKSFWFEWRKVEGIPLYRVSVYGWDRLLWQGTTSDSRIECPRDLCNFEPGEQYYWLVEGLMGNSALKSEPVKFRVLSDDVGHQLDQALSDPDLPVLSKIRLCLSLNLYDHALELIGDNLPRQEGHLLRAEIKEKMGLFEDALFEYRSAYLESSLK
jgi:hypothetical protein